MKQTNTITPVENVRCQFHPVNVTFERHEFRQMSQGIAETVHQFVIRLTH